MCPLKPVPTDAHDSITSVVLLNNHVTSRTWACTLQQPHLVLVNKLLVSLLVVCIPPLLKTAECGIVHCCLHIAFKELGLAPDVWAWDVVDSMLLDPACYVLRETALAEHMTH